MRRHVSEPEDAARPEEGRDAFEGDRLPEVGQVMQGIARVDEVRRLALVLVAEEAGPDALQVRDSTCLRPRARRGDHGRGDVDCDDARRFGGGGEGEGAGCGAEVDERAVGAETVLAQKSEVGLGHEAGLPVVAFDVQWVEVLRAGERELVG